MKKRVLSVLLAMILIVAMIPFSASAAEIVASGTCGDNLTWKLDTDGVLTISGEGRMMSYFSSTDRPWHDFKEDIGSVIIESGVTSIGYNAFNMCSSLTSVTIPDSVTRIGERAFVGCTSLTEVTIPNSVTTIDISAFFGCTGLTSVTIPDGVVNIEGQAFYGCTALTDVTIPASVDFIDSYALGYSNLIFDSDTNLLIDTEKVENFTITGYAGTAAEEYAANNGFTFIALDEDEEDPEPDEPPVEDVVFNDVSESDWYYTPVQWAVANNVTAGTSDTTFSPSNKCTREQAVTFLWNAKGQPEPQGAENPFTDVKEGAWYYKAVLWAVENNITAGVSADKFGVGQPCTRGQIVTFLHNYAGRPTASGTNPFTDVPASQWYYEPVLWAVSNGVTAGMTPTTFGPTSTCTRGQIVTFLYNYLGK